MRRLAIAAILVSQAALAQTMPAPPVGPDNGFFRPRPFNDPSLTRDPVPPQQQLEQQAAPPALPVQQPVADPPGPVPIPNAASGEPLPVVAADAELRRAEREAEIERLKAAAQPQPIAGAFTGLTGERDR